MKEVEIVNLTLKMASHFAHQGGTRLSLIFMTTSFDWYDVISNLLLYWSIPG